MPRYALRIEYDGGPFAGWQRQDGPHTVQQAVEDALRKLEPDLQGIAAAGRTDAGVHATGQVAHVDLARDWTPFRLSEALNYHLKPAPVAITACAPVAQDWHARFSALERRYLFRVVARRAPLTTDRGTVWQVARALDLAAMQTAASCLEGRHDFTTFRAVHCQARSPVKTLEEVRISSQPYAAGTEYRFTFRARSFLHNQVRSMVGSLVQVGAGSWTPADLRRALAACDRAACGPVSPPHGLYLTGVDYGDADPFAAL
jgi:tRNA pseudouridine38-40 synthase